MSRFPRAVAIGYPHYVLQRGNYRQTVFEDDADYRLYLEWLKEHTERYNLKMWAYCLMQNHVHYICVPLNENSLAKTFNTLQMRYARYYNEKKGLHGHLWQGRFCSSILDDRHAYEAVRYIENNPVRNNLVDMAYSYPWSSARSHVIKEADPIVCNEFHAVNSIADWSSYLQEKGEETLVNEIRQSIKTGRPCGDEIFIREIEALLDRKLMAAPRGRPPKANNKLRVSKNANSKK